MSGTFWAFALLCADADVAATSASAQTAATMTTRFMRASETLQSITKARLGTRDASLAVKFRDQRHVIGRGIAARRGACDARRRDRLQVTAVDVIDPLEEIAVRNAASVAGRHSRPSFGALRR